MRHAPELQRNTVKVVALVPNVIEEPFVAALSSDAAMMAWRALVLSW